MNLTRFNENPLGCFRIGVGREANEQTGRHDERCGRILKLYE